MARTHPYRRGEPDGPGERAALLRTVGVLLRQQAADTIARARASVVRARDTREALNEPALNALVPLREGLRAAEAQVLARDRFLALALHELRQPISAIRMAAALLTAPKATPQAKERAARVVARQAERCERLVSDLLELARSSSGLLRVEPRPARLGQIVHEACDDLRPEIEARRQVLEVVLPAADVPVHADSDRLHQVFSNLLRNAMKFTGEHGRITVSLTVDAERATVLVRDTGAGIAPEKLSTIFQFFTRAHDEQTEGFGVGLGIAKAIVEAHAGSIEARSDGPGRGAEFAVVLPLARP